MMKRIFLTIEYNGKDYVGWQKQTSGISIQELIEDAIKRFCGKSISVFGAGRTDSGVHANGQVAHADFPDDCDENRIMLAINAHLKDKKVKILKARKVKPETHARFSALWREYKYTILNRLAPPVLKEGLVFHQKHKLDISLMKSASKIFIGTHNFTSFRSKQCQSKSPIKTIDSINIKTQNEEIIFTIRAKSFLHHQIRNFIGSFQLIGLRKWNENDLIDALNKKDRSAAGPTAPACGLVFSFVKYPDSIYLNCD